MLLAVALGRAIALVTVTRLRKAGFEMVWSSPKRVKRTARGARIVLEAELRNRGPEDVLGVSLRAIASSMLSVTAVPETFALPARGQVTVALEVEGRRVGRWGVHGLALEVRGTPLGSQGLYEVPLLFANPVGIEVLPPALSAFLASPRGGRARRASEVGRPANIAGEGDELRELRDHVAGDPFKRIAWKASARRGRMMVREMEREDRDVLWLVVDASVDLWAGAPGAAPLDRMLDEVAVMATRHLRRGDKVGLVVFASRLRSWIAPEEGTAQGALIAAALASAANMVDADRSELDEAGVAARVVEHARPLDPAGLRDVRRGDLDSLSNRADELRARAPFAPRLPTAPTPREARLRHYMSAFGMESPPRTTGEREASEKMLGQVLDRLALEKARPSFVHVWAPPPLRLDAARKTISGMRARRIGLRWSVPRLDSGIGDDGRRKNVVANVVDEAVRVRARIERIRGERLLLRLGVHQVVGAVVRPSMREAPSEAAEDAAQ
jgi:uncharacterized protein (DUF58 family)